MIRDTICQIYQKTLPAKTRYHLFHLRKSPGLTLYQLVLPLLDPSVANLTQRLAELKGKYQGQRCFVFGNGPSLNQMELSRFSGEHIWASNRFYLIFDQIDWRPEFYVGIDKRVIPDISLDISHLQNNFPQMLFFFPLDFRERRILHSTPNTLWFREPRPDAPDTKSLSFSRDCTKEVALAKTVTISMIQLAAYMGFNPIYLVGCDTSYTVPQTVISEDERNEYLVSTIDDDPNHFHPGYFGAGKKWHQPHVERMIAHYEQVKIACDASNIKIYNATVGGNLEVFPRVDYLDILKKGKL
jgi:hypothetical protein